MGRSSKTMSNDSAKKQMTQKYHNDGRAPDTTEKLINNDNDSGHVNVAVPFDGLPSPTSTETPLPSMLEYQKLLSDTDDSDSIISSIINDSSTISTTTIDREPILKKLSFSGKKASGLRGPSKSIPKKPSCIKQEQYKYRDGIPTQLTIKTPLQRKRKPTTVMVRERVCPVWNKL